MSEPEPRLASAIDEVDRENAADPRRTVVEGDERPYELAYADDLERWLRALVPDPSPALRFAARAQHVRRWELPRASYPAGRKGYLAWRRKLQDHHVEVSLAILERHGLARELGGPVERILRKRGLGADDEVQAMEDALCLVTLERQLDDLASKLERNKLVDVLRKTWGKMSAAGRERALAMPLAAEARALLHEATHP